MKTRRDAALEHKSSEQTNHGSVRRSKKAPGSAETLRHQDAVAQPAVERQLASGRRTAKKQPNQAENDVKTTTEPSLPTERRKKRKCQDTRQQPQPEGAAGIPAPNSSRKGSMASAKGRSLPFNGGGDMPLSQPAKKSRPAAEKLGSTARTPAAIRDAAHPGVDDDDDAPEEVNASGVLPTITPNSMPCSLFSNL